jgi:RHS repeat-associated protein
VDDQRRKSVYKVNGQIKQTRYYLGDYEEEHNSDGNIRKIHYLSGAIYIDNSNYSDSLYYVYTDNQGSVIALTDDAGNVKRRFAYDPWGKRRNPQNWNLTDDLAGLIINRGYTGHEHLDAFGIINMNGRVYDPLTAQFFSPDPFIQAPDNWVNYNRYGYVFGNPLSYTDPTGYVSEFSEFFRDNWKPVVTTIAAIGVGAGIFIATGGVGAPLATQAALGILSASASSATSGALGTALNGGSFGDCLIAGTKGAIFGGMSAMATAGVGDIFGGVGLIADNKFNILREIGRAGAHSAAQGAIAVLRGGDFWQGAASGALGSIGGSIAQGYGITNFWGTVTISSVSGGVGAYIGGARSAEDILFGMATGAIVGGLNHAMHEAGEKKEEREIIEFFSRLRAHYEGKTGTDIRLNRKEFDFLISRGKINWKASKYNESTKTFSTIIDFYNSDTDLKLSFGRATVYYTDNNGKATFTGFHDVYDFDPKPWGEGRSFVNEVITRTYNSYSSGKKFEINF